MRTHTTGSATHNRFRFWSQFVGSRRTRWTDHVVGDIAILCGFAGDAIVGALALLFSFWLRFRSGLGESSLPSVALHDYAQYLGFGVAMLVGSLTYFGIYNRRLLLHRREVLFKVIRASLIWLLLFLGCAEVFRAQPPISRIFVLIAAGSVAGGAVAWRWAFHQIITTEAIARHLRQRIVFVGWTPEAGRLAELVWRNQTDPCEIVGYVDLPQGQTQLAPPANVPYLGNFSDLAHILETENINIALLTDVNITGNAILQLSTLCEKELVAFKIIPSYFPILVSAMHVEMVSGTPVLGVDRLPLNHLRNRVLKRLIDIAGALIGLTLAAPVIAIFGGLVYLESPGPIFYRQRRLGRKGMPFDMLKIRSMRLDAEKDGKVGWSTKHDPRRLKIGSFMRRWNIDEVPQFWNVLKGDMSLVGPRPERPELIKDFKHEVPHYNARHTVKPGVTGWAQVNGLRGDTDLADRIRHDIFYMENWSVLFDLRTMFLTFFKHKNAC